MTTKTKAYPQLLKMDGDYDSHPNQEMENLLPEMLVGLSANQVLRHPLMKHIIVDKVQFHYIEKLITTTEKNGQILKHVSNGGPTAWKDFKDILNDTKHYKLLDLIYRREMGVNEESADLWLRIAQKALKKCKKVIIDDLDPLTTLDAFEVDEVMTDSAEIRDIREQTTTTQKNELIYTEVDKQGTIGYDALKLTLEKTLQTGVLGSLQKAERDLMNDLTTSRDILEDHINYRLAKAGIQCPIPLRHKSNSKIHLLNKLRELTDAFEEKYKSEFDKMLGHVINPAELNPGMYSIILDEVFVDGITWERIIAVISFAGAIASSCYIGSSKISILECTSKFFEEKINTWIREQGGWVEMLHHFDEQKAGSHSGGSIKVDENKLKAQQIALKLREEGDRIDLTLKGLAFEQKTYRYTASELLLAVAAAFTIGYTLK